MNHFKQYLLAFFILPAVISPVFSRQTAIQPTRIDTVILVGNEKTKDYIILREIPFHFPDTLQEEDFQLIHNRIQNLFLFNRVQLHVSPLGNQKALIISVTESWYFWPVPLLFINEHDWDKISYGLQVSHYNFRGRNEKVSLGGWLGYNPSFFIDYFNPWIGSKKRIILGFSIYHKKTANKIFDFDESRSGAGLTVGRKLNLRLQTRLSFALQRVALPDVYRQFSVSGDGTDWMPVITYKIEYDSRDLYEYPRNGILASYRIRRVGLKKDQPQFWQFRLDNRFYHPIYKKLSFGIRNLSILTKGEMPIYSRIYLGYTDRIRGYFNRVFPPPTSYREYRSTNLSLTSMEIRFPILPIKYFTWDDAPLLPGLYTDLKFGISGAIFMDSGMVWEKKSQLAANNLYSGYGAGLHFHLPYVYVFRLDYAWNDRGTGQLIVDVGVSF